MTDRNAPRKQTQAARETIERKFPGATIIDVTSHADEPWLRFSPFYPHGGIPIPNSPGHFGQSAEGIWQGLKVFETEDIDPTKWEITNLKGIKRSTRTRGKVLGHRFGIGSAELLEYRQARYQIYLPTYRWVLDNCLTAEVERLRSMAESAMVVLLDFETNRDVDVLLRPLSHRRVDRPVLRGGLANVTIVTALR